MDRVRLEFEKIYLAIHEEEVLSQLFISRFLLDLQDVFNRLWLLDDGGAVQLAGKVAW